MSREREGKNQLDKVLGLAGAQLPDALDLKPGNTAKLTLSR